MEEKEHQGEGRDTLQNDNIVHLLENIKTTVVESFEKLDKDIRECRQDIHAVKDKIRERDQHEISRLSVTARSR